MDKRVAVARDADVGEIAVGGVRAHRDRRHAAVHGIEAVPAADEIRGGLRRAADARQLHHVLRLDVETPGGLDDGGGDRVVAAAGAQRRQPAFVVAAREAERILRQRGMTDFRFRQEGHATPDLAAAPDRFELAGLGFDFGEHALDDELGGDRQAAVVQQRAQLRLLDAGLEREQRTHLRVAVLLDDEHQLLLLEEFLHVLAERERAQRACSWS